MTAGRLAAVQLDLVAGICTCVQLYNFFYSRYFCSCTAIPCCKAALQVQRLALLFNIYTSSLWQCLRYILSNDKFYEVVEFCEVYNAILNHPLRVAIRRAIIGYHIVVCCFHPAFKSLASSFIRRRWRLFILFLIVKHCRIGLIHIIDRFLNILLLSLFLIIPAILGEIACEMAILLNYSWFKCYCPLAQLFWAEHLVVHSLIL